MRDERLNSCDVHLDENYACAEQAREKRLRCSNLKDRPSIGGRSPWPADEIEETAGKR